MYIRMENVTKKFGKDVIALNNVNIEFKKNKITGLIGFNGSGKTTSFNLLTNFIEKFSGKITIDGDPINSKIKQKISYLSAGAEPKNPTKVITHLFEIASLYQISRQKAKKIIFKLSKKMEFTTFLKKPIKSLSKGNQQKIKVITCLLNPELEILFLDEPFDGLDPIMVSKIKKIFMSLKKVTIIVTSHRMNVVQQMCDEFYILKDGFIVDKKKTDDKLILVSINKQVSIRKINKFKFIVWAKRTNKEILVLLKDIKDFRKLNKEIVNARNFKWCSLKQKDITESVFESYDK